MRLLQLAAVFALVASAANAEGGISIVKAVAGDHATAGHHMTHHEKADHTHHHSKGHHSHHPPAEVSELSAAASAGPAHLQELRDAVDRVQHVVHSAEHTATDGNILKRHLQQAPTGTMPYNLEGCYWDRYEAKTTGTYAGTVLTVGTYKDCQKRCAGNTGCGWFVWGDWRGGECYMKGPGTVTLVNQTKNGGRYVSGPKTCPTTTTTTTKAASTVATTTTKATTTKATTTTTKAGAVVEYTKIPTYVTAGPANTIRNAAFQKGYLFGSAIFMERMNDVNYKNFAANELNLLVPEKACKPDVAQSECDALYDFAKANGQTVRYHVLLSRSIDPVLLKDGTTPDQKRQWIRDTFAQKVKKYADRSVAIDVVNEVLQDNQNDAPAGGWIMRNYEFYPSVPDHVDIAFLEAKKNLPAGWRGKLCINDYLVESVGGVQGHINKANALFNYVKDLRRRNIPVDCVGFQTHKSLWKDNTEAIIAGIAQNIARYRDIGVEVQFTEIDWSCGYFDTAGTTFIQCKDAGGWSSEKEAAQAEVYRRLVAICRQYANCKVYATWGFYDPQSWYPNDHALLLNADYSKKLSYFSILNEFKK